jgi:hypothetical protein
MPDLNATLLRWGAHEGVVFAESRYTATVARGPMTWEGVDRFRMDGDRALSARSFFDHGALAARAARSPRHWRRWLAAHRRARARDPALRRQRDGAAFAVRRTVGPRAR